MLPADAIKKIWKNIFALQSRQGWLLTFFAMYEVSGLKQWLGYLLELPRNSYYLLVNHWWEREYSWWHNQASRNRLHLWTMESGPTNVFGQVWWEGLQTLSNIVEATADPFLPALATLAAIKKVRLLMWIVSLGSNLWWSNPRWWRGVVNAQVWPRPVALMLTINHLLQYLDLDPIDQVLSCINIY